MLALSATLATRDRIATLIGSPLVCLLALLTWLVYYYGKKS